MKATLSFNLPEEKQEHLRAAKATDMAIALFEIQSNVYKQVANDPAIEAIEGSEIVLDAVFKRINAIISDNNLNLEELIN